MSASILTTIERDGLMLVATYTDVSAEVARKGDVIHCEAKDPGPHTTFSWSLVFTPDSPNGSESAAGLETPPGVSGTVCQFTVDHEGAYLVRLVVDAGLPSEQTRFVRIRYQTLFGDVRLVAAGERRDAVGVIPYDLTTEGWANQQNQNLQKLLAYVRRVSTSGRVLYVDANRGRHTWEAGQGINDEQNTVHLPGSDPAALEVSGITTGAEGFADFSSINAAIAYAHCCAERDEAALTPEHPYYVLIYPGLYIEDVVFEENVHLIGLHAPEKYVRGVVVQTAATSTSHIYSGDSDTDLVICKNIVFENLRPESTKPVVDVRRGMMQMEGCSIRQTVGTGPSALRVVTTDIAHMASADLDNCSVTNGISNEAMCAIMAGSDNGSLSLKDCYVQGPSGIRLNGDFGNGIYEDYTANLVRSKILSSHADGTTISSSADALHIVHSKVQGNDPDKRLVVGGGGKAGDLRLYLNHSDLGAADIQFNTTNVTGTSKIYLESSTYGGFTFPAAAPEVVSETQGKSVKHLSVYADPFNNGTVAVPAPHQLGAESVQDAVDDLTVLATPLSSSTDGSNVFMGLDGAYDAFTSVDPPLKGSGHGRRIVADAGPVQIIQAAAPDLPGVTVGAGAGNKNGHLQVEGSVEVGGIDTPEIILEPNPFLAGPHILMGDTIWPSDIVACGETITNHRSLPAAIVQARSTSVAHNYNMRLQTQSTSNASNGSIGWLILRAGDSLDKATIGPHAGGVYLQAGSYLNDLASVGNDCSPGTIFLAPGYATADAVLTGEEQYGWVRLVDLSGASFATLTAQGAPGAFGAGGSITDAAGKIVIATAMGHVKASITVGMDIAAVIAAFNDPDEGGGLLVASDDGAGKLVLTSTDRGPLAEILYVFDEPTDGGAANAVCQTVGNLRVSSGSGAAPHAVYSAGSYDSFVNIHAPEHNKIEIGAGGLVGSMTYDADTGKLTVPGAIDPTCVIFAEADHTAADGDGTVGGVTTIAGQGAIFVSNGAAGLIDNGLYYRRESNAAPMPVVTGSGNPGEVALWGADATLEGDAALTWDSVTGLSFDMDSASMIRVIDNGVLGTNADPQVQLLDKENGAGNDPVLQAAWGFLNPANTHVSLKNFHDPGNIDLVTTNGDIIIPNGNVHVEAGKIGIGVAPVAHLSIEDAASDPVISLKRATSHWNLIAHHADDYFAINEEGVGSPFVVIPGGNVGIGTTAPTENLQIGGGGESKDGDLMLFSDAGDSHSLFIMDALGLHDDQAGIYWRHGGSNKWSITTKADGDLDIYDRQGGGTSMLHFQHAADGCIGVGTDAALVEKLEVAGAVKIGASADADAAVGTLRYDGNDFQGRTGAGWESLTGGAVLSVHTDIQADITLTAAEYINAVYVGVNAAQADPANNTDINVELPNTEATGALIGRRIHIKDETAGGAPSLTWNDDGDDPPVTPEVPVKITVSTAGGGGQIDTSTDAVEMTEDNQSLLVICVDNNGGAGPAKWFII